MFAGCQDIYSLFSTGSWMLICMHAEEGRGVRARPLSWSPLLPTRRCSEFHNTPVCEGDASPDTLPAQDAAQQLLSHHAFLPPVNAPPPPTLVESPDLVRTYGFSLVISSVRMNVGGFCLLYTHCDAVISTRVRRPFVMFFKHPTTLHLWLTEYLRLCDQCIFGQEREIQQKINTV